MSFLPTSISARPTFGWSAQSTSTASMTSGELIGQTEWPPSCRTMPTDCASRISAMSVPEIFSPFGSELSASTACRHRDIEGVCVRYRSFLI